MKLAFSGQGRYPDFDKGYELYVKRNRTDGYMDRESYARVVRKYCKMLAESLEEEGMVDLPAGLGSICAALFTRKPQYRGEKFVGYGKMLWDKGHYDGSMKAFGLLYMPRRDKSQNLRCYGFVANRRLFQRMKEKYDKRECNWVPIEFSNEMV